VIRNQATVISLDWVVNFGVGFHSDIGSIADCLLSINLFF
jgi:hypothetical protein